MSDEDDLLAAEHALGLSDASARMAADAEFARAVDTWRARMLPMMATEERTPPPELWARIATALPAAEPAPTSVAPRPSGWRAGTFAASAVAAVLFGVLLLRPDPPAGPSGPPPTVASVEPAPRIMVAALIPSAGDSMVSVMFDGREGRMTVMPMRMDAGGRTPELWVIPADGKPRSLGVIPEKEPATMLIAPAHRTMVGGGAMLAISLEPAGGSPTGRPTGPVVMSGKMQRV